MSLIVNGTMVKKINVIKDGITTELKMLKVGDVIVFTSDFMPVPNKLAKFSITQSTPIVSYGDINDGSSDGNLNTIVNNGDAALGGNNAIFLTKYIPNNGKPYQTLCRAYVGNKESTPNFMNDGAGSLILSATNYERFSHRYIPVDYYGAQICPDSSWIPMLSQSLGTIGADPISGRSLPHHTDFEGVRGFNDLRVYEGNYTDRQVIIVFAESIEMRNFRKANESVDIIDKLFVNSEIPESCYLLFQPYDSAEYDEAINYYFGENWTSSSKAGDVDSFYNNTGVSSSSLNNYDIVIMDGINNWNDYFGSIGIQFSNGNPFYDIIQDCLNNGNTDNVFYGPWVSPNATWDTTGSAVAGIALFMDKIPYGATTNLKTYPIVFGPQALGEALSTGLISSTDPHLSNEAKGNIEALKKVYENFENDGQIFDVVEILKNSDGSTAFNMSVYDARNIDTDFYVGIFES